MITRALAALAVATGLLLAAPAMAAVQAGKATFVRGVATAQGADGAARIVSADQPIFEGDVLRTAANSYAVLQLADESKLTLRPNTVFKVEAFDNSRDEAGSGSVFLRLFKGGLRAITGLVGKRNPRGFQVRSSLATIGIRGTDFEARLCEDDCRREAAGTRTGRAKKIPVIGRVAFLSGTLSAAGRDGTSRDLKLGTSLFEGDVLETGARSVAVLVFRDESRVTMRADSTLKVDEFAFDRDEPESGSVFMSFVRGGIRLVSGLVAKARPERVRLATPVATIAVRGTGFELKCEDPCTAGPSAQGGSPLLDLLVPRANAQAPAGMTAFVFDGTIEFQVPGGTFVIDQGKAAFFDGINPPVTLPAIPLYFVQANVAQQQINTDTDPGVVQTITTPEREQSDAQPGLYVRVVSGDVEVVKPDSSEPPILAGAGETVIAVPQTGDVYTITAAPGVLPNITPTPEVFTPGGSSLTPPADADTTDVTTPFECVVQ